MSVRVGEIHATMDLDKKPFDASLKGAEGNAKGFGSRIGGILGGVGKAFLTLGAVGGAAAGGLAFVTGNMASDMNEALSKVGVVFGQNAGQIENWADDAAQNLGLSKAAALGAAGTFGNLFVSMGLGAEPTRDMSTGIVELAGDLASFNNMDPTEVLDKLRAGLVGETEPLRALGVNISAVATEAKAMEMGLGGVGRELTAAEKAQANYAIIMEQTATAQGDFARTSDGMANQQRILAATFQDAMASIGQAFIPLFEAILPQVTQAFQQFALWFTQNLPMIQEITGNVVGFIGDAFTFIFTTILPAVIEGFQLVLPIIQSVMGGAGDAVGTFSSDVLPGLLGVVESVVGWVTDNWPSIENTIRVVMANVTTAVEWVISNVLPPLVEAASAVVGWVVSNWPTISSIIGQVFGAVAAAVKFIWPIVEAIARVLFPIVAVAASVLFNAVSIAMKGIGGAVQVASTVISTVVNTIKSVWTGLSTAANSIFQAISVRVSSFGTAFGRVFNGIANVARTVWETVSGAIKGGINIVIGLVNKMIGFLNGIRVGIPRINIPGTDIGLGGGYFDPFNLPYIPRLARGTQNFPGGFAMVGERGPELAYLPQGSRVWPTGTGPGGGTMVNGPLVHIDNFNGSRSEIDRLTRQLNDRLRLRTGHSLTVGG